MENSPVICPHCRQSDKIYKVSQLYLEGTARINHQDTVDQQKLNNLIGELAPGETNSIAITQLLNRLIKIIAPPEGSKQMSRRIHPDSVVLFFGLLMLVILYQVAVTQPGQLPVLAIILGAGMLAYILARRTVVQRYADHLRREQEENNRVEHAVGKWMRLYFCSRDQGVFNPDTGQYTSTENLHELLE